MCDAGRQSAPLETSLDRCFGRTRRHLQRSRRFSRRVAQTRQRITPVSSRVHQIGRGRPAGENKRTCEDSLIQGGADPKALSARRRSRDSRGSARRVSPRRFARFTCSKRSRHPRRSRRNLPPEPRTLARSLARSPQLISSSHSDSPTSSECLSGSASTRLLSECLSERSELMEARL